MNTEQERAEFESWCETRTLGTGRDHEGYYISLETALSWEAYQAGRAALQSQDSEEVMEMALCESRRLVLRIGQAYRFVPMKGCKTCEEMKAEHDDAYAIDHARRIEGDGE